MQAPSSGELSALAGRAAPEAPLTTTEDEVVYAVSHDLRGPLLNFQGFLRRLVSACEALETQAQKWELPAAQRQVCRELLQQKIRSSVEVLERNARRMDSLLQALLELSRAGREPLRFERVAAREIVLAVIKQLRTDVAQKAAASRAEMRADPLPELWADSDRLAIIYRQLLSNALKFAPPGRSGRITLGGETNGDQTLCWVRDNGIGIKPPHQRRIFTPFGRVREMEAPGEGVGLAICRKLMGQMGGSIWAESEHGEGSTFYLAFPAGPAADGRAAQRG